MLEADKTRDNSTKLGKIWDNKDEVPLTESERGRSELGNSGKSRD